MTRLKFIESYWLIYNKMIIFQTDDITMTADGVDTYQIVKDAKRYQYVFLSQYLDLIILTKWYVYWYKICFIL